MKNNLLIALLSVTVLTSIQIAAYSKSKVDLTTTKALISQQEAPNPPCTANDPTGTPLNVRSKPNGKIIAQLKNGTIVEQTNTPRTDKWVEISFLSGKRKVTGWVFRDYLACQ